MTRTEHIHDNECPNCMFGGPGQCDACIAREDLIAELERNKAMLLEAADRAVNYLDESCVGRHREHLRWAINEVLP